MRKTGQIILLDAPPREVTPWAFANREFFGGAPRLTRLGGANLVV